MTRSIFSSTAQGLGDALRAALRPYGLSRFASQAKPAAAIASSDSNRSAVDAAIIAPGKPAVRRGVGNQNTAAIGAEHNLAPTNPTGEAGAPNLSTLFAVPWSLVAAAFAVAAFAASFISWSAQ